MLAVEMFNRVMLAGNLIRKRPDIKSTVTDYERYWEEKRSGDTFGRLPPFQRDRAEWALRRIEKGGKVLDIGCGDGSILRHMATRKEIVPVGADISENVLRKLEAMGVGVFKFDIEKDSPELLPECDHILLFEVLEHLKNPEDLLPRMLKKAGKSVFVSVPNTGYFPYRIRLLLGSFPVQWRIHPGEHLRFWTYRDFQWWLAQLGMKERSETGCYQGIPIANRIFPNLFGMGIIAEIRK
jgi:methionine biosynthesis protein MetW